MDRKTLFSLCVMLFVSSIFLIVYKKHYNTSEASDKTNWIWEDKWQSEGYSPVPPVKIDTKEEKKEDKKQIVAKTYKEAIDRSKETKMPVLMIYGADWCSWCVKFEKETLTDKEVKEVMKNYIFLHVDSDDHPDLVDKFSVSGLPCYLITNSKEESVKKDTGYVSAKVFVKWLDNPKLYP